MLLCPGDDPALGTAAQPAPGTDSSASLGTHLAGTQWQKGGCCGWQWREGQVLAHSLCEHLQGRWEQVRCAVCMTPPGRFPEPKPSNPSL